MPGPAPQVIDDPAGSKLLLVMEFVEGGPVLTRESLEKRDKLPESLARQYFRDMVKVGGGRGAQAGRHASPHAQCGCGCRRGCPHVHVKDACARIEFGMIQVGLRVL